MISSNGDSAPGTASGKHRVFISCSWDMEEEAAAATRIIHRLSYESPHGQVYEPYRWTTQDRTWTSGETWQELIPRVAEFDYVVSLIGDRVGEALPASFPLKALQDFRLSDLDAMGVDSRLLAPPGTEPRSDQIPLTGTLFEYFDARVTRWRNKSRWPQLLVYRREIKEGSKRLRNYLDLWERHAKHLKFNNHTYPQQVDWLERVATNFFRGHPCHSFETTAEFARKFELDMRGFLDLEKPRISELKGLQPYGGSMYLT